MRTSKVKIVVAILVLSSLFCLGNSSYLSEKSELEEVITSTQEKYRKIDSIEAKFIQRNFISPLNQFREFKGKLFLQRPHLFAMEVTSPEYQRLVFDGDFFWVYTANNNQAVKSLVAPEFFKHPLINLLTTIAELKKHFSISLTETGPDQDYSLKLTLRTPEKDIRTVSLTVKRKGFQVKELTIYYESGNYTQLALMDIKENPDISKEHFLFLPPAGTEIVENPAPITHP